MDKKEKENNHGRTQVGNGLLQGLANNMQNNLNNVNPKPNKINVNMEEDDGSKEKASKKASNAEKEKKAPKNKEHKAATTKQKKDSPKPKKEEPKKPKKANSIEVNMDQPHIPEEVKKDAEQFSKSKEIAEITGSNEEEKADAVPVESEDEIFKKLDANMKTHKKVPEKKLEEKEDGKSEELVESEKQVKKLQDKGKHTGQTGMLELKNASTNRKRHYIGRRITKAEADNALRETYAKKVVKSDNGVKATLIIRQNVPTKESEALVHKTAKLISISTGNVYEISEAYYSLGKSQNAICTIPNRFVSRFHAAILRQEDGNYSIQDLGSTNGTFVNERKLSKEKSMPLYGGETIRLADSEFIFTISEEPERVGITG